MNQSTCRVTTRPSPLAAYRQLAVTATSRAHVPYSSTPAAVVLVLDDGTWVPGVRVESASFSITMPALLNAVSTAVSLGISRIRAVVASRPLHPPEIAFAESSHLLGHLEQTAPDALGAATELPHPGQSLSPILRRYFEASDVFSVVRQVAERAFVPESDFPVGCVIDVGDDEYIAGVNVEHSDWTQVICAERNALGTAFSYGYRSIRSLYLSCLRRPGCTPCGACRQWLAELAPTSVLWMDRGELPPRSSDPVTLLPDFFSGSQLSRIT